MKSNRKTKIRKINIIKELKELEITKKELKQLEIEKNK